jgi:hypothetical protein
MITLSPLVGYTVYAVCPSVRPYVRIYLQRPGVDSIPSLIVSLGPYSAKKPEGQSRSFATHLYTGKTVFTI